MRRIPLMICAAALSVTCLSCGKKEKGDGSNHMYEVALCGNPKSLDPQYASDPASETAIKNLYSGLVEADPSGKISCRNALSYTVSPDEKKYTFVLREDNYWYFDKNGDREAQEEEFSPVVAEDYAYALRRLLDPKMQSPYARDFACVKNGERAIKGEVSPNDIGVSAPDDHTLVIELDYPCAEFMGALASSAAFPCNKEFFDSTKGRYGLDEKSVMSNGAFYIRQWFYDPYGVHNILYMRRSDMNASPERPTLPSHLNFTIQKNEADVRELFKEGDIECVATLASSYSGDKYSITSSRSVTLGLIFNDKDRLFKSEKLRKALSLAIDRKSLGERIGDDIETASGIIPPAVSLAGRSYRELSSDEQFARFDVAEAKELLEEAKKELGVGSVDQVKILVNSETVDSGDLHLLSQSWQELLGVYVGIEDVTPAEFEKRLAEGNYSLALYPLSAKRNSCFSALESFEDDEVLKKVKGAAGITEGLLRCGGVSEAAAAYTEAERKLLEGAGFVPLFYKNSYLVAYKGNEDIIYDPFSGAIDFRSAQNFE